VTVSEKRITPEIYLSRSGVENKSYLYFLLFSKVFSTPRGTNFLPIVPSDSSAAKIPFPAAHIFLAFSASSYLKSFFSM
jgi:hypothetical protein